MIIKGSDIQQTKGRRPYNLDGRTLELKHFATRVTTPENPFLPHKHEQKELWFIISGKGIVIIEGTEYPVKRDDLIILDPWQEHGLKTETEITWICMG